MHAAAAIEIWSFQETSDPRVTTNIEILSLNSSEFESNDMSGKFQSTRLEIRQHCVFKKKVLRVLNKDKNYLLNNVFNNKSILKNDSIWLMKNIEIRILCTCFDLFSNLKSTLN